MPDKTNIILILFLICRHASYLTMYLLRESTPMTFTLTLREFVKDMSYIEHNTAYAVISRVL